jgi:hypothetical protein
MIVEAGGRLHSFADAAFAVGLTGLSISARHVQQLTQEVGAELAQTVDGKAERRRRRQPSERVGPPPDLVAVEVDGGHLRTRAADGGPGVHQAQNQEDKVACLVTLQGDAHAQDPQPEPPPSFQKPRRVQRLVRQMAGQAAEASGADPEPADTSQAADGQPEPSNPGEPAGNPGAEPWAPKRLVRTCVASMVSSQAFGPLVAGEAHFRDFYRARRRAFLGDGQAYNWSIWKGYFWDFEPIVDLLHVICYLYAAAYAVRPTEADGWALYVSWLRACWQGRVAEVLEELRVWQGRVGVPPAGEELATRDPRRVVAEGLSYLGNNQGRMDYPRYRRLGLPITSSLVESLVGEFNARVKDRRKFWKRPAGAEGILQVRAALLSQDGRLARHFAQRPGSPYRRRKAS